MSEDKEISIPGYCKCGFRLADGGAVGLYCTNKSCPEECKLSNEWFAKKDKIRKAKKDILKWAQQQKNLPKEYADILNKHFWELLND